ncbi:MAG TPA: STAS domain-containing protein [Mycobacteriales bacterium]|nr:STAS domain-containing protein [Mycobacteriales bacterium]
MDLSLTTHNDGGTAVVGVSGEVDVYSAPALGERINELLDSGQRRLVVDLNSVEFIDSTGLGTLVSGHNRAAELGGSLSLVCNVDRVIKLMRITGLDEVFTIKSDVSDALAD